MEMAIKRGRDSEREMVEGRGGGRGRDRSRDRDLEFATERKRGGGEREGWWRDREGLGGGGRERENSKRIVALGPFGPIQQPVLAILPAQINTSILQIDTASTKTLLISE